MILELPTSLQDVAVTAGAVALIVGAHISRERYENRPEEATFEPDPVPAHWIAVVPLDCDGPCRRPHVPHEVTGDNTAVCVGCGHVTPGVARG